VSAKVKVAVWKIGVVRAWLGLRRLLPACTARVEARGAAGGSSSVERDERVLWCEIVMAGLHRVVAVRSFSGSVGRNTRQGRSSKKEAPSNPEGACLQAHDSQTCSHLPDFEPKSVGIGTFPESGCCRLNRGCRGFTGPFPPPLWMSVPLYQDIRLVTAAHGSIQGVRLSRNRGLES